MGNREEICGKFENILWNCDVLRGIPQKIFKVYTKKKIFEENIERFLKYYESCWNFLKNGLNITFE